MNNNSNDKVLKDIFVLYELVLAIGESLDLRESCRVFTKALMSRKNLGFVSCWLKNEYLPDQKDKDLISLVYAYPEYQIENTTLPLDHPIVTMLSKKTFFTIGSSDNHFSQILTEKGVEKWAVAVFALKDIGFLKLFTAAKGVLFDESELYQMQDVVFKFATHLEGCLAQRLLCVEIDERLRVEEELKKHREHLEELVESRTRKLRENEKRFSDVAESSCEWIWEVDASGLYTYASPVVEKILGYKPIEVVGKKYFYDFFHPDIREDLKNKALEVFARQGSFREFINQNVDVNGKSVWLSTSGMPVLDESGKLLGYRGADVDITDRRQMEENFVKAERIAADAKVAAFAQIAAEAAHEIKNPLQVVKTGIYYLNMLVGKKNTDVEQTIKQIENAITRAVGFIDDLLNFSKPLQLEITKYQINDVIVKAIDEIPINTLADIKITQNLSNNISKVSVDVNRIKQIITNLAKNAAEAMEDVKSKKLEIRSWTEGEFVKISILDTGKGIPKEDVGKIFDPFYTTKKKGTGLGLSICYRLVEAHHGKIEVESEVGVGTKFVVCLPTK